VARSPSKPITEYLAYLLAQGVNRQLDARFRKEGVPVEQWRILKVLSPQHWLSSAKDGQEMN
jgi:hypothetical protein